MTSPEPSDLDASAPMALLDLIIGGWMSQTIYVAARLGIADRLAEGAKDANELAATVGAEPDALYRLLRSLASLGVCTERADGVFELTPVGGALRSGVAGSLRSLALHWGGSSWAMWATLDHSVRTGRRLRLFPGRDADAARLADSTRGAGVFREAMAEITGLIAETLVERYDFSAIERIVDVGGGHGELLVALLRAQPTMHGVLFDLSPVLELARAGIEAAGVGARCDIVAGDFFDSVPNGASAYVLKCVIHDWDDDQSARILQNCRRAMIGGGRLLLVERVLPERMQPRLEHRRLAASDLNMLVATGGRERTEGDLRALLARAGFALARIVPIGADLSVIEAVPDENMPIH